MSGWLERKQWRREYYSRFIEGWKLRPCTSCAGSGYYDDNGSPKCGACDGTGKEKYRESKDERTNGIR